MLKFWLKKCALYVGIYGTCHAFGVWSTEFKLELTCGGLEQWGSGVFIQNCIWCVTHGLQICVDLAGLRLWFRRPIRGRRSVLAVGTTTVLIQSRSTFPETPPFVFLVFWYPLPRNTTETGGQSGSGVQLRFSVWDRFFSRILLTWLVVLGFDPCAATRKPVAEVAIVFFFKLWTNRFSAQRDPVWFSLNSARFLNGLAKSPFAITVSENLRFWPVNTPDRIRCHWACAILAVISSQLHSA